MSDRFIRGFTEKGDIIGKRTDQEANLWLNPQSWGVISGLADSRQANLALDTVYEKLNTEYGAMLMTPPYHKHAFDGALAVIYNAGTKENAGIFSQSQGWLILLKLTADMEIVHSSILWKMRRQRRTSGRKSAGWSHIAMGSLQKEQTARILGGRTCTG